MFFNIEKGVFSRVLTWGLCIFIAVFPFILYPGYVFNGTSTRTVNLVLFAGLFAVWFGALLFQKETRLSLAKSPVLIGLFFFLGILFVAGITGVDFGSSFWSKATRTSGLFYLLHLGVFILFLTSLFRDEKKQRLFLKVFIISSALFSVGALLGKEGWGILFVNKPWRGFTFGNSTFAAMYLFAAFLTAIYYAVSLPEQKKVWWKYLFPLVIIFNPFFISQDALLGKVNIFQNPLGIMGSANATFFTTLFSVGALLGAWFIGNIRSLKVRKIGVYTTVILGVIVAFVGFRSLLSPGGYVREVYLRQATEARPILWELSQNAIDSRPVFGWGGDNFDRALEAYYDNRILEEKKGGEGWFDRAHNIFIDQTVDSGYVGVVAYVLVYILIFYTMVFVVLRAREKKDQQLAVILIVYFIGHLLELQTAFDTTISYIAVAIMAALSITLFHKVKTEISGAKSEWEIRSGFRYAIGGVVIVLFGWLLLFGTVPLMRAQGANGEIALAGTSLKRIPLYEKMFSSPLDEAAFLHRIFFGLQEGISQKPAIVSDSKKREGFVKEFEVLAGYYKEYLTKHPNDYRAHLEFSELYIYARLFDVNHLDEVHKILDDAIVLVPQAPQAYWLHSVAYLYQAKFKEAREWAQKAYDLNPAIEESKRVMEYIDTSIKNFPEIDLFAFKKI